ncbi:TlpA disulfide reductase family protein [Methylomagnum ishizawai]|uniref:TlpA disulfide reductase family protein n=1 Tax=Methylomagnum ishizawai TaxID=1760988 RepID=UPI001C32BAAE|nr:TlpA disulfide reductase family protein [Methylomagnum ishizawai]BBL75928.1 thiol:disulfide interchange protein [Methylomagnum ishizawai]
MITTRRLIASIFAAALGATAQAATEGPVPSCPATALGQSHTLDPAQLKGKVGYIDFWASWCGPCAQSFPFMNELHREFQAQGLEIIALNLDEEAQDAQDFLKKYPASFPIASDPQGKCPQKFDVKAMPTSFLVDRQGKIRHVHMGFRDGDKAAIKQQVQALLNER